MAAEISANVTLHQRAMRELKELVFISLYLTLGSVILMKTAVLHTEGIALGSGASPWSRPWCWPNSCCPAMP